MPARRSVGNDRMVDSMAGPRNSGTLVERAVTARVRLGAIGWTLFRTTFERHRTYSRGLGQRARYDALSAGIFVLALRGVLARLYVLPIELVTIIALVNLSYSAFSLTLAARTRSARPLALVVSLAAANGFWACVCTFLVIRCWNVATFLGLAHIAFEGVFVLALATIEWRNRQRSSSERTLWL
jgi:hypothetical protein